VSWSLRPTTAHTASRTYPHAHHPYPHTPTHPHTRTKPHTHTYRKRKFGSIRLHKARKTWKAPIRRCCGLVHGIAMLAQRTQKQCDPTRARTCTPNAHATYTTKVVDQHVPHDDSPVRRRKVRQREQFWALLAEAHEEVTWLRGMFTSMQQRLRASTRDGTVKPFHQLEVLALEEALHALRTREKTVSRRECRRESMARIPCAGNPQTAQSDVGTAPTALFR